MQAIVTCVDYDDFLRLTLRRTMEHFSRVIVLTTPEDEKTQKLCEDLRVGPGLPACVITSEFYRGGGRNNKGAAIDAGLRVAGPRGWICLLDADVHLPKKMDLSGIEPGCLYSPHRRMMELPGPIPHEDEWDALPGGPEHRRGEYAGYFQLFHSSDEHFTGPPWYRTPDWDTFQGSDTVFWRKWMPKSMRRLPFEVLHLGTPRLNWRGRITDKWIE